jgi:hypothetical protein
MRLPGNILDSSSVAPDEGFDEERLRRWYRSRADQTDRFDLAIVDRETGECVGEVVLNEWEPENASCNFRILIGPRGPVILDAECAWFGDPAFDVAFVLNHLLLKGAWHRAWRERYLEAFEALWRAYVARVAWEPVADVEARAAALLPALLLARVDGKSPVEYLTREPDRDSVRRFARERVLTSPTSLASVAADWNRAA